MWITSFPGGSINLTEALKGLQAIPEKRAGAKVELKARASTKGGGHVCACG